MIDFMCIGAHKAGTTWLHSNLILHPGVWLPPFKELHHFDQQQHFDQKGRYRTGHLYRRVLWFSSLLKDVQDDLKEGSQVSDVNFDLIRWASDYSLTPPAERTDQWYVGLFSAVDENQVCGEITPAYATLNKSSFNRIRALNPEIKIIFMMRNPVHRTWSSFRFDKMTKKENALSQQLVNQFEMADVIDYANQKGTVARSDYLATVSKIEQVYDKKNIHYIFFDDLERAPLEVLNSVCDFLNVPYSAGFFPEARKKKLISIKKTMPENIENYLVEHYADMLGQLNEIVPLPKGWRVSAK